MNLLILSSIKPLLIYFGIVGGMIVLLFVGFMILEAFPPFGPFYAKEEDQEKTKEDIEQEE